MVLAFTTKPVIAGLEEAVRLDLAVELNWQVLKTFRRGFREIYTASGEGVGGKRVGVTAAAFIEGLIGRLFDIEYRGVSDSVRIVPNIPRSLYGNTIALNDLILPTGGGTRLSVRVKQDSARSSRVAVSISGVLPKGNLEIALAGTGRNVVVPAQRFYTATFK